MRLSQTLHFLTHPKLAHKSSSDRGFTTLLLKFFRTRHARRDTILLQFGMHRKVRKPSGVEGVQENSKSADDEAASLRPVARYALRMPWLSRAHEHRCVLECAVRLIKCNGTRRQSCRQME